jgi:osmotically inducible lipoprotein OsmB
MHGRISMLNCGRNNGYRPAFCRHDTAEKNMKTAFPLITAVTLGLALAACGHGTEQRAATGAIAGAVVAGPIGAAVGAGVGAAVSKAEGE